jgi:hypothetical protein
MVRGLRRDEINTQTGRIKKAAFIPRRNGKDDDGLSVSEPESDCREALRIRMRNADGLFARILAGQIRAVAEGNVHLEVCPEPTHEDPHHALIIGVPTNKSEKALAARLAEILAAAAQQYLPPC